MSDAAETLATDIETLRARAAYHKAGHQMSWLDGLLAALQARDLSGIDFARRAIRSAQAYYLAQGRPGFANLQGQVGDLYDRAAFLA